MSLYTRGFEDVHNETLPEHNSSNQPEALSYHQLEMLQQAFRGF
jgi:hypothetical protein